MNVCPESDRFTAGWALDEINKLRRRSDDSPPGQSPEAEPKLRQAYKVILCVETSGYLI